jgi:hypothetical protein
VKPEAIRMYFFHIYSHILYKAGIDYVSIEEINGVIDNIFGNNDFCTLNDLKKLCNKFEKCFVFSVLKQFDSDED